MAFIAAASMRAEAESDKSWVKQENKIELAQNNLEQNTQPEDKKTGQSTELAYSEESKNAAAEKEPEQKKADPEPVENQEQSTRDPFSPTYNGIIKTFNTANSEPAVNNAVNPLTTAKVNTFKVVATIVSEKSSIAALKAINSLDYVVAVGDKVGSEGGEISEISYEGVTISSFDGKVFIPVSNKIEVKVDKKS